MTALLFKGQFEHSRDAANLAVAAAREKHAGKGPVSDSWDIEDHLTALKARIVPLRSIGAELISAAIPIAISVTGDRAQVGGYANRFTASPTPGTEANNGLSNFRDDLDPATYCTIVRSWMDDGATIVGGCCGITPEHISAIAALGNS